MRVLLDTNVLIRLADPAQSLHGTASTAVETLHRGGHELYIVPQNIYEFWSVATRTTAHNGLGLTPTEAQRSIDAYTRLFRLLRDERAIYEIWLDLVVQHSFTGVRSFDARLAAAMRRHDLDHLLTFNPSDFRRFAHVRILEPAQIVAGS